MAFRSSPKLPVKRSVGLRMHGEEHTVLLGKARLIAVEAIASEVLRDAGVARRLRPDDLSALDVLFPYPRVDGVREGKPPC